jgi:hypothetical protein
VQPTRKRAAAGSSGAAAAIRAKRPRTDAQQANDVRWRSRWGVLRGRTEDGDGGTAAGVIDSALRGRLPRRKRRIAEVDED